MSYLLLIGRYWKVIAVILLLGLMYLWGYSTARLAGKFALASMEAQVKADALAQIEQAQQHAYEADEALRKAQAVIPHTGSKVNDAVRAHPTDRRCVVPDAAADALHQGIEAGAAATSG